MTDEKMRALAEDVVMLVPQREILEKHGISRTTFYRIRQDRRFKKILQDLRCAAWEKTIDQCYAMAETSIEMLIKTMQDEKAPINSRITAANKILDTAKEHFDEVAILTKIEDIEERYTSET
jgi:TATA-binding protein-associated factor Taf7